MRLFCWQIASLIMDTQMPPSLDSLLTITFHHQTYDHNRIRLIQAIIHAEIMLLQNRRVARGSAAGVGAPVNGAHLAIFALSSC